MQTYIPSDIKQDKRDEADWCSSVVNHSIVNVWNIGKLGHEKFELGLVLKL